MRRVALPHLTAQPHEQQHRLQPTGGPASQIASEQVTALAAHLKVDPAHVWLAALWILLHRYAQYDQEPVSLGLSRAIAADSRVLNEWPQPDDEFAEIVVGIGPALAPASAPVAAVLKWGLGEGGELEAAAELVVQVDPDRPGNVSVRVPGEASNSVVAGAVQHDLLALLGSLCAADGPVAEVDAFSTGLTSEPAVSRRRLQDIVVEHAEQTPEAVAVRGRSTVTYVELVRRSRRLCAALLAQGVSVEDRVGLYGNRDEEMMVGLLGVLMSGAAFVPLSPEDPPPRRREILRDAKVSLVVVAEGLGGDLADQARLVPIEGGSDGDGADAVPSASEAAAYVLYTSGSTGHPKGVVVEHRQLMAYAEGFLERLGTPGPLKCAMVQPLTVDSSLTCVATAWITGGELQVVDRSTALDFKLLAARQEGHRADVLKIAPSHLRALQSAGELAAIAPTTALVVGGEASEWSWLQTLDDELGCSIFNHYGPTETTVGVLMLPVADHRGRPWTSAALGQPLRGCQVVVVDQYGCEVPAGVRGELVVRGELLARGYQTASANSGFRLWHRTPAYWTGDRGLRELDGVICFAGRSDDQVKVRGFRVELAEISRAIMTHPLIADAVAVVETDQAGRASVSCVVESNGPDAPDPHDLVAHCRRLLPEHMVPGRWLMGAEFPRTPHGKVDRAALRAKIAIDGASTAHTGEATRAPATDGADEIDVLTQCWQEVLGGAPTSQETNFFDAGGHSLLLVDLQRVIAAKTGREIELLDLFQYTTIEAQADLIRQGATPNRPVGSSGRRRRQEALARRRSQQKKRGGRG